MPIPRKILIRVIGAPLLVAALCGLLYWGHGFEQRGVPNYPLYGLLLVVAMVSSFEIQSMSGVRGISVDGRVMRATLIAVFLVWMRGETRAGFHPVFGFAGAIVVLFLVLACDLVFRYGKFHLDGAGITFFGFCYISLLGFLLFPPFSKALNSYYLLFLLAAGKGSDMAAFVAGKSIGKHKMAPEVSPNKTWEGGIAGGIVGTGAGFAVLMLTPLRESYARVPVVALLFFCLIVTIAGQVGDLVKSAIKRWAGVKDSGRILPEFGGMLDMVDSFLLEGPVACLGTLLLFLFFKGS